MKVQILKPFHYSKSKSLDLSNFLEFFFSQNNLNKPEGFMNLSWLTLTLWKTCIFKTKTPQTFAIPNVKFSKLFLKHNGNKLLKPIKCFINSNQDHMIIMIIFMLSFTLFSFNHVIILGFSNGMINFKKIFQLGFKNGGYFMVPYKKFFVLKS